MATYTNLTNCIYDFDATFWASSESRCPASEFNDQDSQAIPSIGNGFKMANRFIGTQNLYPNLSFEAKDTTSDIVPPGLLAGSRLAQYCHREYRMWRGRSMTRVSSWSLLGHFLAVGMRDMIVGLHFRMHAAKVDHTIRGALPLPYT